MSFGNKIKQLIYGLPIHKRSFNSKEYWQNRYLIGGNSGAGSYGRLAKFKAEIINDFVKKNKIKLVVEFGCGDGNQLSLFKIQKYVGLDVSKKSIELCRRLFLTDKDKSFFLYDPYCFIDNLSLFNSDLTLSLDVIYHLVEDEVFDKYMQDLFSTSKKYVIIYASNTNKNKTLQAQHVKHREFTKWIKEKLPNWKLTNKIENEFKLKDNDKEESFADFYFFKKIN